MQAQKQDVKNNSKGKYVDTYDRLCAIKTYKCPVVYNIFSKFKCMTTITQKIGRCT